MASAMAKERTFPFSTVLRLTAEQRDQIDEWRRKQPDIPGRTEAIRRLLELALRAA